MCLSSRPHQPLRGSDVGLGYELGLSVYCPVMPLPQSSLNPMCTYPDVLLYILLFPRLQSGKDPETLCHMTRAQ